MPENGINLVRNVWGGLVDNALAETYNGRLCARASVAQLDSASVFGTEGWGFESLRAYF